MQVGDRVEVVENYLSGQHEFLGKQGVIIGRVDSTWLVDFGGDQLSFWEGELQQIN
jgi:hypothetical protein